jgi:hypothetical protein
MRTILPTIFAGSAILNRSASLRASASLTMATRGAPARSRAVKPRPESSGMSSVSK